MAVSVHMVVADLPDDPATDQLDVAAIIVPGARGARVHPAPRIMELGGVFSKRKTDKCKHFFFRVARPKQPESFLEVRSSGLCLRPSERASRCPGKPSSERT